MMFTLTEKDLARMRPELRNELIQFILNNDQNHDHFYDNPPEDIDLENEELLPNFNEDSFPEDDPASSGTTKKKVKNVIEIDIIQAKDLISNLSDKSINTLKEFTIEEPVNLSTLVGKGRPYSTYIELKRSFVGPVNRRLRTVTGNRTAVLFLKADEEGSEDDTQIAVRKVTAQALKSVLELDTGNTNAK